MKRRSIGWLVLGMMLGIATVLAMIRAEKAFQSYVGGRSASIQTACELLPSDVALLAVVPDFSEHWTSLRQSDFYGSLKNLSVLRDVLNEWRLDDADAAPIERWLVQYWGRSLVAAYSKKNETLYLLSPVGNRGDCLEWIGRMANSLFGSHIGWERRELEGRLCVDADASYFLSRRFHIQLSLVHGVAVAAIGPKAEPLRDFLQAAQSPEKSLGRVPGFMEFLQRGIQNSNRSFGLVRWGSESDDRLGAEWSIEKDPQGRLVLDITGPVGSITAASSSNRPLAMTLSCLRQPDDLISSIFSWEDGCVIWEECLQHLPSKWIEPVHQIQPSTWFEGYQPYWKPVFQKLGREIFIGFGEADVISDRYRIPFPRTILALPFDDPPAFIRAMEETVLKCNQELEANLLIRKSVRSYGEFYEVVMGDSAWKSQHGLKQLPVVAFSKGIVILARNKSDMEKVLQNFSENLAKNPEPKGEGIELQIQMRQAPNIIRILLAAVGAFGLQGENVFLSPATMHSLGEVFSLMEQFGESQVQVTYQPGRLRLRSVLAP